jgi:hypothetical protein
MPSLPTAIAAGVIHVSLMSTIGSCRRTWSDTRRPRASLPPRPRRTGWRRSPSQTARRRSAEIGPERMRAHWLAPRRPKLWPAGATARRSASPATRYYLIATGNERLDARYRGLRDERGANAKVSSAPPRRMRVCAGTRFSTRSRFLLVQGSSERCVAGCYRSGWQQQ